MHEERYINDTPLSYRKELGQFFTPPLIARLMIQWITQNQPKTVLDPAFGLGVFYDEIIKFRLANSLNFTGYEIDNNVIKFLDSIQEKNNLSIIHGDYLEAEIGGFDSIICNPPYMRFQKFLNRHNILPRIERKIGKKLVGYVNTSSVFLLKSLTELNKNGNLAFIMPFEFFNTGYGETIKEILVEYNMLKQIIIFSNEKEIFPDAITTICILLCKNDSNEDSVKITRITSKNQISEISDIDKLYDYEVQYSDLPFNKKWTPIINSLFSKVKHINGFCRLSSYGSFTRGIATGANDFFALNKSKIEKYSLNDKNICKCITKSSQIRLPVFTDDDFENLYVRDKPVYCLDIKEHEDQEVLKYIREGEYNGYHLRYLTRSRKIWYEIEHRLPSPILIGVFNRGRFKVIRNFTTAVNFTCFHGFYPNMFGSSLINKLFVYLLSDFGQEVIKMNKRTYGGELDKFEPGDLNNSFFPSPDQFESIAEEDALYIIDISKKNETQAIDFSNSLIKKIIKA